MSDELEVCETVTGYNIYHLRALGASVAICGRTVMASGIRLSDWNTDTLPKHLLPAPRWCRECEATRKELTVTDPNRERWKQEAHLAADYLEGTNKELGPYERSAFIDGYLVACEKYAARWVEWDRVRELYRSGWIQTPKTISKRKGALTEITHILMIPPASPPPGGEA